MGEWHWNMYNIIYEMSRQSRFNAWYWMLGAGALGRPRGMVWGGRREEGSGWGTHVYLGQIHFDIWQNQYNIVKLNKIKLKTKKQKTNNPAHWEHQCPCASHWSLTLFALSWDPWWALCWGPLGSHPLFSLCGDFQVIGIWLVSADYINGWMHQPQGGAWGRSTQFLVLFCIQTHS